MPSISKSHRRDRASRKAKFSGRQSGAKFLQQTAMAHGEIRATAKAVLDRSRPIYPSRLPGGIFL